MRRRSLVLFPFTVVLAIACQNQPTVPSEGETEGGPPGAAGLGDWESPGAHGQTLFAAGEYHEAIREFRQAAALSPLHRQTYYLDWVAASYLALREYEKVLDICEEIHRIDRDDLYALASRLRAYQELGRNAEGLELAERALRRKGPGGTADEAEILRHYAYFLAETGSLARSIEVYEALLAGGEPIADFADHLRLQYVKAGRYRDAFAAWRAKWGSGVAFWEGNQFGARYENVRRLSGLAEDARPSALRPSMASAPPRGGFAPSASPGA
ncbi:MAG: tetratricopeptide repeat protein, partial [Planctomycetes bacterium]|nr:tetratricopeptide repeat protein [Planctomycetota bacterium]